MLQTRSSKFANLSISIAYPRTYIFSLCVLFLFSCHTEKIGSDELLGKWSVVKASRNGSETKTLEDGYFEFISDSIFRTNIFSKEEQYRYELTEEGFKQQGGEMVEYLIEDSDPDSLILQTIIRNYEFLFIAVRDTLEEVSTDL